MALMLLEHDPQASGCLHHIFLFNAAPLQPMVYIDRIALLKVLYAIISLPHNLSTVHFLNKAK